MAKGRRLKPTVIKDLQGTKRPDRDKGLQNLPATNLVKLPPAPDYLTGHGLRYYNEQGRDYLSAGLLSAYSLPLFLSICQYISRIEIYSELLDKEKDLDQIIKLQRILNDTQKNLRLTMVEFGLTPASIGKIPKPVKDTESRLDKFKRS